MFVGIIAALFASSEALMDRYSFTHKIFGYKKLLFYTFIMMIAIMTLGLPFFFEWNPAILEPVNIVYLGIVVVISLAFNLLWLHGLEKTRVEKAQPLYMSSKIFTIILAIAFFPTERHLLKVFLAIIAIGAIISLNISKKHLDLDRYAMMIIGGAFLLSLHNIFIKNLLGLMNAFMLYYIRIILIAVFMLFFFKIDKKDIVEDKIIFLFFLSITVVLANAFIYWSYAQIGLVYTSLLLTLTPIAALWGAKVILKEELHIKNIVATVIIIACISASFVV